VIKGKALCGSIPVVGVAACWLHVIYPSFLMAWPVSGVALRLGLKAWGLLSLGAGNLRSNPIKRRIKPVLGTFFNQPFCPRRAGEKALASSPGPTINLLCYSF